MYDLARRGAVGVGSAPEPRGAAQPLETTTDHPRDPDPPAGPKFVFWREELKRVWSDLRGGDMSAERIAASVALGLFIGCLPIFGLHLPIVLVLCLRFRLDGALAYVAANVSNPFFAPFLFTGEVQLGAFLFEGHWVHIESKLDLIQALSAFPKYLLAGAPLMGLGLGLGIGILTFVFVVSKRKIFGPGKKRALYALPASAPPWIVATERVASRYASAQGASPAERTQFHYVRIKLVMDPIAKLIADIAGDAAGALGEVVDVGTGRGQLPILLTELGRATKAYGFDWDEKKIHDGQAAAKKPECGAPLPVELERADAREGKMPEADTVLVIDLLHYFTIEEQDGILRRAARAVRRGGRIVVREADTERGMRSWATLLEEKVFTTLRFNRGERVRFRPAREIAAILEEEGLASRIAPAWGKTPFSNVLIVGERSAPSSEVHSPS